MTLLADLRDLKRQTAAMMRMLPPTITGMMPISRIKRITRSIDTGLSRLALLNTSELLLDILFSCILAVLCPGINKLNKHLYYDGGLLSIKAHACMYVCICVCVYVCIDV